jgi:hypothetical protein
MDLLLDSIIRQEQAVVGDVRDGAYGEHMAKEQLDWHRDKQPRPDRHDENFGCWREVISFTMSIGHSLLVFC